APPGNPRPRRARARRQRRRRRGAHAERTDSARARMCAVSTALALAESLSRLGTETAFDVLARAKALERQGRDVIHLEIGEPDFETPAHVSEAGIAAIRAGQTHYCPTAGLPEFREAIADYLGRTRGIAV